MKEIFVDRIVILGYDFSDFLEKKIMNNNQLARQLNYLWILGGGLTRRPDGTFKTNSFDDSGDKFGTTLDRLRVDAAAVLYRLNPGLILAPSAGKGQYQNDPNYPTVASVMKQELIALGVPETNIISEEKSSSTNAQLNALVRFRDSHPGNYGVLSNRYHLERIRALLDFNPLLVSLKGLVILSAEDILIESDPSTWQAPVERIYQGEGMNKRIELERKGTADIKRGRYVFR